MSTDTQQPAGADVEQALIELALGGMTCASCAARIEKRLNRLDGATATVNYATETAKVSYDPGRLTVADLISTVEAIGYRAGGAGEPGMTMEFQSGNWPSGTGSSSAPARRSPLTA